MFVLFSDVVCLVELMCGFVVIYVGELFDIVVILVIGGGGVCVVMDELCGLVWWVLLLCVVFIY